MPVPGRLAVTGGAQATGRYLMRRYAGVTSSLPGLDAGRDRARGNEQERIRRYG
jgi:hypothetical protein